MTVYLLPQNDANPAQRAAGLAAMKQKYNTEMIIGIPSSTYVDPQNDAAGPFWVTGMIRTILDLRYNLAGFGAKAKFKFAKPIPPSLSQPKQFVDWLKEAALSANFKKEAIRYFIPNVGYGLSYNRPTSIDDYKSIFVKTKLPELAKVYETDESFARGFVAGADPVVIKRMKQIPAYFPISDKHFSSVPALQGDSLAQAIQEHRVFYVDHSKLSVLVNANYNADVKKYAYAPMIALAVPRGGGALLPFAIQCGPTPEGRQIYTPADGYSWRIARNCALVGHNIHQASTTHLGLTHLILGPVTVAMRRHLATNHPVYALLNHHTEGTLVIDYGSVHTVLEPGGLFDQIIGCTVTSIANFMVPVRIGYSFTGNYLPTRLARQQTDDATWLADYPYRDDGMLIWNAISNWTKAFIGCFYTSNAEVMADTELQNWAAEIASPAIGKITDFGATPGSIRSQKDLAEILTMIIWTAGAQHGVVNNAQATDLTFVPANPLAGYTPEPSGLGHTEQDYLNNLPPMEVAVAQFELMTILGEMHYGSLGDYSGLPVPSNGIGSDFTDGPVAQALAEFQRNLQEIEQVINDRNTKRTPYVHLLPSRIPQSINL